ncbi:hypothetical protein CONCODRAFT_72843 [Conidiobolus coronatus NRRL 28638]|uniref:HTH CENPB-type domain-containing protein n=1 Tax=Conidiobolus coronatus (strain ATCC 28846 / CBS 209.66 / NRRL 28638) TaxID=796925 RepID=A0A137NXM9_CONC2|nr:hypothetical protein CONCODRAFT_72843 [Conidiobolus coronatus NRRL 28638]|eukprot:KXN67620.1 hypothetical protein CONCODRAFT_72843 [Conidiobolus coronatus NRRL 28638]
MEKILAAWIENVQEKLQLTVKLIKTKAQFIHSNLLGQTNIKFSTSNGWFHRFKNCHKIKRYRYIGEAKSVDEDYINKELPKLNSITRQYSLANIYNMDESALYLQPNLI